MKADATLGRSIAGLSVLVVEDMYLIGASLAAGLEQAGAHVIGPIGTVREALAALDPLPDLATLDVQLDCETSFPVADELVRLGVPFVFATATSSSIPAAHRERIVCAKPYTMIAILTALHRALAGAVSAGDGITASARNGHDHYHATPCIAGLKRTSANRTGWGQRREHQPHHGRRRACRAGMDRSRHPA